MAAIEMIVLARTMSPRKYAAQVLNVLGLADRGGRPTLRFPSSRRQEARVRSRAQHDLDVDAVRHLNPHQLPQRALVRVEVDEPLVDPHLPAVPRLAPLAVGGLPHRHDEPFRREGNRPGHRDAGAFADQLDLLAHVVDRLRVEGRDDLLEGARDLGRMGVEDRRVPGRDDARVIQDDDLRGERLRHGRRVVRRAGDVPPAEVLLVDPAHVESDVVAGLRLLDLLVVHLDRLDFADLVRGHEVDFHPDLQEPGLDPADGDGACARDRVDVLHREAQREIRWLRRDRELVQRLDERRPLVPRHLGRRFDDVLALVRADRDERDLVDLVADAPQEPGELRLQFVEARLGERGLRRVHLVDRHDQLLDAEGAREKDVFLRLRLDALCGADDEDRGVRLGRARDHVLDEVPVARGVDDREVVLVRVKALMRDVDREPAFPLFLDLVHDEGELERGLAHLLGEFLEILQLVRVDVPGVVEDPADGRRLPVVDVADEHEVEVWLRGHGFYPVGRTLSSCRIYAYPTRAIFSIGTNQMEGFTRRQIGGPPTQSHLHGTARSPICSCGAGRRTPTPSTRRDAGRPLPRAVGGTRIRYPSGAPYRGTVSACTPPRPR